MKIEVIVGAPAFWDQLRADLESAHHRAWVQTFTFEGDRVGTALGRALERCDAPDRRLLIDGYSRLYHNDRLIPGPAWLDREFRREVLITHRWVRRLRRGGARVRFGNRLGPAPTRLIRRNHKKLIIVDGVTYLGGINFSDHNFAWHDMMLRITSPAVAEALASDFEGSWRGRPQTMDRQLGSLRVLSLNGRRNAQGMQPVLDAVASARRSIRVQSAYLSHPFTRHLREAAERGVRVQILTPADNNKSNLARHILHAASRWGFEVIRHPGMSHLKAMLIDDELLVAGSSNFDFMSFHVLEELLVLTRDPATVEAYRTRVWEPDARAGQRTLPRRSIGTRLGHTAVHAGSRVAALLALT